MGTKKSVVLILVATSCFGVANSRGIFGFFNKKTSTVAPPSLSSQPQLRTCDCVCGKRNEGSRIVGGENTELHEFPWMVRLSYINRFYCGGTLINDRYVLTAAHCVKGFMWFLIKVTFGEYDKCNVTTKAESRFVIRATMNKFSYFNFDNDIAVLRLNDRVPISDNIRPVCLPTVKDNLYEGKTATASGWGVTQEDGMIPCIVQKVELPVMTNSECKNTNYTESMISDNMLCAGFPEGEKDSCQGDSGGPLVYPREDNKYELIGVVSWGHGCARPGFPGVYTRVTRYLDWIKTLTKDGCFCNADYEATPTDGALSNSTNNTS